MAKARKVELPAQTGDGQVPVYIPPADATADELREMETQARTEAEALLADDAPGDPMGRIEQAEQWIAAIDAIQARGVEIVAEQAEANRRIDEARSRLNKPTEPDADPAADEDNADADADATDDDTDDESTAPVVQHDTATDPSVTAGEPMLVAGGGRALRPVKDAPVRVRSAAAAAAGSGPAPKLPARRDQNAAYLTASAEVHGFAAGQKLDWGQFGSAAEKRFGALPHPRPGTTASGARVQLGIGTVNIPTEDENLVAGGQGTGDFAEADAAIEWAVSNARLKDRTGEDSLVAAGGWCAPSETLYDLLDITTDDGMLDVPGITVTRGGVRYSLGPDFTQVYVTGNANFTRTEAQAIAGSPTKPMVNIPCPTFTDNRMVVDGLYLTGDILSSKGYPEAYADYTQKALKAFAHYVNAASIADMVSLSTVVDLSTTTGTAPVTNRTGSAAVELLGAVELQVTDMRYKNRLSMTQAVEVVMPFWLRGNIRSDLAKRQGTDMFNVSDADIRQWFAARGASLQFVYDWQDAFTGVSSGFGASTAILGWPTTANILVYPEGTFVRALDPVIELNAVYDSTLLQTNQYVALFMEQGRLTLKRHWDARNLKVAVSPLGGSSAGSPVGAAGLTGSVV